MKFLLDGISEERPILRVFHIVVLGWAVKTLVAYVLLHHADLVGFFIIGISFLAEKVSVAHSDADEVRVSTDDDDGPQEFSEEVVLLLELKVARLRGSPSVVDKLLLVDPHEVDDGPSSNQGGRNDDQDAGAEE